MILLASPLATNPTRPSLSQVALDGSVNSDFSGPVPLDGRDYDVRAEFGHVEGRNLFHSFDRFDLDTGQRATFSAPGALRIGRVISRVTGGDRSDIDGTLRSDIAGADFYFINPAGVVFGRNAQLEIQGSFHVSTADELRFPEGKVFSATNPADSSFSVAAPDAFGFLDRDPRAIRVDGSELDVAPDRSLSLVGGNLVIDSGLIALRDFERNGNVTLVAMSRPGTVAVADGRPSAAPQGRILITGSEIDVSSFAGGGVVRIRAGALVVEDGALIIANSGADERGPATALIEIEAESVRQDLAAIRSIAIGAGDAGDVRVKAGELAVLNRAELSSDTGGSGDAGNVTVSARELEIANGGLIASETFAAGDAGNVLVRADQVTIHTARPDLPTGITTSAVLGTGNAGTVTVEAKETIVRDSGVISSNSLDRGDAGRVELSADHIAVLTGGQIGSGTGERPTEDGGFVRSTGTGGDVVVNARAAILISGQSKLIDPRTDDFPPSGIFASTESTSPDAGNAGRASVTAPVIMIADRGEIASESLNPADAGRLLVSAGRLVIDDGEITTKAESSGDGGRIEVEAGVLELRNGGLITARSTRGGRAGTVTVDAHAIELRSGAAISSSSRRNGAAGEVEVRVDDRLLLLEGSEVTTTSARAGGGSIGLRVGDTIVLRDSEVTTSVEGGDDPTAGNITIDPEILVIDGGRVKAEARGALMGEGGEITIIADNILVPGGDFQALVDRGDISATGGPAGVDGTVVVDAPDVDLSGGLVVLEGALLDAASQLRERCGARRDVGASSFTGVGRGGLPPGPDGPLGSAYQSADGALRAAGAALQPGKEAARGKRQAAQGATWPAVAGLAPCRGGL